MTILSPELIVLIPKRFCGLRVLLVEPDKTSLENHAHILSHNSYQVTTTQEVATGLSKILNGESYDCVLIDADISEMDMVDFLHQTFKHQPHLSIIMMASVNIRMRLLKETLENEAVLCLTKPCGPRDICNIWKHVCRKTILSERRDYSNGESKENQVPDIFKRVDPMVNPTMINNNLSSGSGTQEGLNINLQDYAALFKPIPYKGIPSNDHDQEHVGEHKRSNDQLLEDDRYCKKIKDNYKKRITWTSDLHEKFVEAINALGKQKAYPTTILETMKVPGLTRNQVASHLQKYQDHKKTIKNPTLIPQKQRDNIVQVESYAYKRRGQATPSDDYASILQSSIIQPPLTLNSTGITFMSINNIKARLQTVPPLHVRQPTTTLNNSNSDHQSTDQSLYHIFQCSMGETNKITTFGLVENCNSSTGQRNEVQMTGNSYGSATGPLEDIETLAMTPVDFGEVVASLDAASLSNGFVSENFGDASASLTPLDYSGFEIEPWVSEMALSDYGLGTDLQPLEGFAVGGENYTPEMCEISNMFGMTNSDGGRTSASSNHNDLLHFQDFQGNGENLFPTFPPTTAPDDVEHSINPNFSNSDLVSFGVGSVGYSHPGFPSEENNRQEQTLPPFNSIVSVDGIERTLMESDLFANGNQCFLDMTVDLLDELDADIIMGPW